MLVAHQCAATHPDLKILHRDIGGGNILLYPRVVVENEIRRLRWRGILIDWEVSRPIIEEGAPSIPRQPERTVGVFSITNSSEARSIFQPLFLGVMAVHVSKHPQ